MYSGGKSYPTSARGGQCNVQQHHAPNDRHHPRPPKFGAKRQRLEEASSDSNYSQYSPIGRDNDRRELAGDVFAVACQPPTRQNSHHIMTYSSMDNGDHYDDSSLEDKNDEPSVIEKLEDFLLESFFDQLVHDGTTEIPTVPMINTEDKKLSLENIHQCRNLTSILLVASYCHRLLLAGRTTTTREVYYYYVTHFHHQRECEKAIWDLTILLGLSSRLSLGLTSSPKGWFCGSITLYHEQTGEKFLDGRELDTHGAAITPTTYGDSSKILLAEDGWLQALQQGANLGGQQPRRLRLKSDAKCIVVIEKEGVYTRLSEDRIFDGIPCILVTGKGEWSSGTFNRNR